MKRLLILILFLLTAAVGAAAALLSDANLRKLTETALSAGLGREFRVDGEFAVELGAPLRATASSVRLTNPGWAEEPNMMAAERLEIAIDPWSLIDSRPIVVESLVIEKLEGNLIRGESDQVNWEFGGAEAPGEISVLIQELHVSGTVLTIERPDAASVPIVIDTLRQVETPEGLLETALVGEFNGRPISASGRLGPFQNLLQGKNVRVSLDATVGELRISASGLLDELARPRQPTLRLDLAAPDARELIKMFGLDQPVQGKVEFAFDLEPLAAGIGLSASGRWGRNHLDAEGQIMDLPTLDGIEMSATGGGPDLRDALGMFGLKSLPAMPFRFTGAVNRHGRDLRIQELAFTAGDLVFELQGDMRDFPSLNDAALGLRIKGRDLAAFRESFDLPGLSAGPFSVNGRLHRSQDGYDRFLIEAETELGHGTLTGTLSGAPGYVGSRVTIRAMGPSLRRLGELLGANRLREQPYAVKGELERLADGFRIVDEITLTAGDSILGVTGETSTPLLAAGTELSWRLSNVDIAELPSLSGQPNTLPSRRLNVSGDLRVERERYLLSDVEGTLGRSAFTLMGDLSRTTNLLGSELRLTLRGPDLEELGFLVGELSLPEGAFDVSARIRRTPNGLRISESQLNLTGANGRFEGELALPAPPLQLGFDFALEGPSAASFWKDTVDLTLAPAPFRVNARGTVNDASWRIDEGSLRLGATEVNLKGAAQRTRKGGAFRFRVETPDLSEPGGWYGLKLPNVGLRLSGTLEQDDDVFNLDQFVALTDKGDFSGSLRYVPGEPPRVNGELKSTRFDPGWLIGSQALHPTGSPERNGTPRAIPDLKLPLEPLKRLDAELSIRADSILLERQTPVKIRVELVLENGALKLAPLSLSGDAGSMIAELAVKPRADTAEVTLSLTAEELATGLFFGAQRNVGTVPRGDWAVNLRSHGTTLRELAANLNGTGKLSSSGGRIAHTRLKSVVFGDLLSSIVNTVNPFYASDPYTDIVCSVFPFTFSDGRMASAPTVVVQTDKLNILSRGTIDLETENLDLTFRTEPRRGLGISAGSVVNPLIRIGGTLAQPALNLSTGGAIATGTAAFFTGGLSLLAQAAVGAAFRTSDPCGNVLEQAQQYLPRHSGG